MDHEYLNIVLWAIGAILAVGILMGLMRRRRDQLVRTLREHVTQQQRTDPPPAASDPKKP